MACGGLRVELFLYLLEVCAGKRLIGFLILLLVSSVNT